MPSRFTSSQMWKVCWNKGRLCWKTAKLFYFCHLKKLVRPKTFGPYYVSFPCKFAKLKYIVYWKHEKLLKFYFFKYESKWRHNMIPLYVSTLWNSHTTNIIFNHLKPTGHVMHQKFNIQQLYVLPTLCLCVLYLSENKQRLVPLTA